MTLRVVGAGVGRTGTTSLKMALERLLGSPCYHMFELLDRPEDTEVWHSAVRGEEVDWGRFLADFAATVDWPACAFWREIHATSPGSVVLLSSRDSAEDWHASAKRTIFATLSKPPPPDDPDWLARRAMVEDMLTRFDPEWRKPEAAMAAYERHNQAVRREVPADRLIDWRPGDGWEPICAALGVAVPDDPFPHTNTAADFRAERDLDPP